MTDVVEIAKQYRERLAAELATLDSFIRTAEALVQNGGGFGRGPVIAADADHFEFDQGTPASENVLVLSDVLSNDAAPVGADAGQRMRHRRWMLGISQQQLGELVDIKIEQIQKYEAGEIRISASTMRKIAAALEVSVSYFVEDPGGQVPDTGGARGDVLTDR